MIDHIYLPVSDLKRSSEFYKKVLGPLGIDMPYEVGQPPIRGFAINNIPGFWLRNGEVAKDLYVAFTAKSADAVRASYKAAIDAGATSNKEPSLRPEWRADYFAANIGDPDGYNIGIFGQAWVGSITANCHDRDQPNVFCRISDRANGRPKTPCRYRCVWNGWRLRYSLRARQSRRE